MRRIVVVGGTGFFGARAVELLPSPVVVSRRTGFDVENRESIRATLRPEDVVVDAAGPFQNRSTALVEAASEIGFDVIDISDSLAYAEKVLALRPRVRVLTSCSSASAVSAAVVRASGIREPVRVTGFLAAATRHTANAGSADSLMRSLGRPIRVWRGGRLVRRPGWRESGGVGRLRGGLFEICDSVLLPRVWPSLRDVNFFVDGHVPGINGALGLAARWPIVRSTVERLQPIGLAASRRFGHSEGRLAYEVEGVNGSLARAEFRAAERGYLIPVIPAALAARAIAEGRFEGRGVVPADRYVEPDELFDALRAHRIGVNFCIIRRSP